MTCIPPEVGVISSGSLLEEKGSEVIQMGFILLNFSYIAIEGIFGYNEVFCLEKV